MPFNLTYIGGWNAVGEYFIDNVQIGGVTIDKVQMGLVNNATAGRGVNNAVLGLGWPNQEAICTSDACATYPTFLDDLVTQGIIDSRTFSIWLNDTNAPTGTILFGGVDTTKYQEPLTSFPMQQDDSGNFSDYSIIVQSVYLISVATGQPEELASVANSPTTYQLEIDSTYTIFAPTVWAVLVETLALQNFSTSSWWTPCNTSDVFISFQLGQSNGPVYTTSFEDCFQPGVTKTVNGTAYCAVTMDTSDNYGGQAILGEVFLRNVYAVYDLDSHTISLAASDSTGTGSNIVEIPAGGKGVPGVNSTVSISAATTTSQTATATCGTAAPHDVAYTQCPGAPGIISTLGLASPSASPSAAFTSTPASTGTASTLSVTNSVLLLLTSIAVGFVGYLG